MSFQNIKPEDTFLQSNETYIITKSKTKYKIQINPFKKVNDLIILFCNKNKIILEKYIVKLKGVVLSLAEKDTLISIITNKYQSKSFSFHLRKFISLYQNIKVQFYIKNYLAHNENIIFEIIDKFLYFIKKDKSYISDISSNNMNNLINNEKNKSTLTFNFKDLRIPYAVEALFDRLKYKNNIEPLKQTLFGCVLIDYSVDDEEIYNGRLYGKEMFKIFENSNTGKGFLNEMLTKNRFQRESLIENIIKNGVSNGVNLKGNYNIGSINYKIKDEDRKNNQNDFFFIKKPLRIVKPCRNSSCNIGNIKNEEVNGQEKVDHKNSSYMLEYKKKVYSDNKYSDFNFNDLKRKYILKKILEPI